MCLHLVLKNTRVVRQARERVGDLEGYGVARHDAQNSNNNDECKNRCNFGPQGKILAPCSRRQRRRGSHSFCCVILLGHLVLDLALDLLELPLALFAVLYFYRCARILSVSSLSICAFYVF
jgi:hypothetical protein